MEKKTEVLEHKKLTSKHQVIAQKGGGKKGDKTERGRHLKPYRPQAQK